MSYADRPYYLLRDINAPVGGSSITVDSQGRLLLVNDEEHPSNSYYYGTNASGVKGWYSIPGGGGSTVWGGITGTLTNQTDLVTALNLKEDISNKSTIALLGSSDTLYPSQKAVRTYVDTHSGVDIRSYGATGDGVTNDSAFIQAALNSGAKVVLVPTGTYLVNTQLTIPAGVTLIGLNKYTSILKTTASIAIVKMDGAVYSSVRQLGFLGNWSGGIDTAQIGIWVENYSENAHISECYFNLFAGYGIYAHNTDYLFIDNCWGDDNYFSVFLDQSAEYGHVSTCHFRGLASIGGAHGSGIKVAGGNNIIIGNDLDYCNYALYLTGGTNDSHGIIAFNECNHAFTRGVYGSGVTLGHEMYGNNFYFSAMEFANCTDIRIHGGSCQNVTFVLTSCTRTKIINLSEKSAITWAVTGEAPDIYTDTRRTATAVSYAVKITDNEVAITSTAATRVMTMPLAAAVTPGKMFTFIDESNAAGTNNITFTASGSDTFVGTTTIASNGGIRILYSDGVSKWFAQPSAADLTASTGIEISGGVVKLSSANHISSNVITTVDGGAQWHIGNSTATWGFGIYSPSSFAYLATPNTQLYLRASDVVEFTDSRGTKKGIQYSATGYETDALSLTSRTFVVGAVSTVTGGTTLTLFNAKTVVLGDTTSAGFTTVLPTAVGNTGLEVTFKKIVAANTWTIGTTSSQTIDGSTTASIVTQYSSITVISDGSNWQII